MFRISTFVSLAAAVGLLGASEAKAQSQTTTQSQTTSQSAGQFPRFGLGPQIGFQKAADADEGNLLFGGAARLKLSQFLGAEASIGYRSEDFADGALSVRSWPIQVTGMLYPLPIVYGAIGFGWYNTTFDFESDLLEDHTDQEVGWHFGAGVELPLGTNTSLAGDIRYVFLDYNFEEVPGFGDTDANFYMITAALLFGL